MPETRAAAARVLAATIGAGQSLGESLPGELARIPAQQRPLLQQLCYGSLRSYQRLQGILQARLSKPLRGKDADLDGLLLCGLYQLLEMRIPDHVAISSSVEACRKLGKPWATGLVNGVLRGCARNREVLAEGLSEAQQHSHPEWLYRELLKAWPDQATDIFSANNEQPPMYLRVNLQRNSREDYLQELQRQGIEASPTAWSPAGLLLKSPLDVTRLPGFAQGCASVQDEAAQLAAIVLAPQAGQRVLDACSAPGGKTCHILELQPGLTELVAWDIDAARLRLVRENLQRLQLQASLELADACAPPGENPAASFDQILLDAPCSGSGVIRRHPDIKLLRRASDIRGYSVVQLQMLQALWPLLKPGGALLYVTCSILPAENDSVVSRFLQHTSSAEVIPIKADWGVAGSCGRQILPMPAGPDGLYFSLLNKKCE